MHTERRKFWNIDDGRWGGRGKKKDKREAEKKINKEKKLRK